MIKKLWSKWRKSLHHDSFKKIIASPKNTLYILLFDVLFFLVIYYLNLFVKELLPTKIGENSIFIYLLPIMLLLYSFLVIFAYSIFKYFILGFLSDMNNKPQKLRFDNRLLKFYSLNMVLFFSVFFFFGFLNLVTKTFINAEYLNKGLLILLVPISIIVYLLWNVAHILYLRREKIREIFRLIFTKEIIKRALFVFLSSLMLFVFYLIIFYGIGFALYGKISQMSFTITLTIITYIAYYLIHFHNRIYLYMIINGKD